ncbi:MAG: glycoside hydrolase, partial [Bacteroidota bacterium]|nr:glycoside hydrolase [Bacteroidota bacterium]
WQTISPDLTRESWDIPASVGIYTNEDMKKMPRRGVIYTIAPSPKDINTIWCGTDDGLIHVTKDGGKNWKIVTPPSVTSWSKVSLMDASHFDVNTVYAAVNRIRLDDMNPHIYKTTDGGKSWKEIVNGLPDDPINAVREDPLRKGLLFAGSEKAVYVSFDDGEHWQSLRLNMPATSIRDLVIKDDDIVVGTHGRSFWILDDITPLRQLTNQLINQSTILYKPQSTYRVRWSMYTDTPLPQEEPSGENPPDGAIINYFLKEKSNSEVVMEIFNSNKKLVRRFSSNDTTYKIPEVNIPLYWIRPQQILSGEAGSHRFVWDLRYEPLNIPASYPISAVYKNTAPNPTSPFVLPGTYIIKFTVDKKSYIQPLTIKMDPRVKTSIADLKKQHDLSLIAYESRKQTMKILDELGTIRKQLKEKLSNANPTSEARIKEADQQAAGLEITPPNSQDQSFTKLNNAFASIFDILQDTDMPPTMQTITATKETQESFKKLINIWQVLKNKINVLLSE